MGGSERVVLSTAASKVSYGQVTPAYKVAVAASNPTNVTECMQKSWRLLFGDRKLLGVGRQELKEDVKAAEL